MRAALLAGDLALASFALMLLILTEIALGAFLALEAALTNAFLTFKSLALIFLALTGSAFLRAFLSAATFLASLSAFLRADFHTGFFA